VARLVAKPNGGAASSLRVASIEIAIGIEIGAV
jgi:hypothetical protein